MELYNEIENLVKQLQISVKKLRETGGDFAKAEMDYKMLLREECLKLKDEKMAIGMIDKVCYGIPSVAKARFKRDVAEAVWKANLESINAIKVEIRVLENQLSREFGVDLND